MTSSKEYHKCVITIPLLDQLISEFNDRFDEYNSKALIALKLLLLNLYDGELPSISTLNTELHAWFIKWKQDKSASDAYSTIGKVLIVGQRHRVYEASQKIHTRSWL